MGLDQNWYVDKSTKEEKLEALITGEELEMENFGYHRKFWDLQEFLDTENCEILEIDSDWLDRLTEFANGYVLESDDITHLETYLEEARFYLDKGYQVFYQADW